MQPRQTYDLSNVLVAGRRRSGTATGTDETDALRRFTAREARELKVDVAAAIQGALTAKGYKAKLQSPTASTEADQLLPAATVTSVDWPAAIRSRQFEQQTTKNVNDELGELAAWKTKVCADCGRTAATTRLNIEAAIHHGAKLRCVDRKTCERIKRKLAAGWAE